MLPEREADILPHGHRVEERGALARGQLAPVLRERTPGWRVNDLDWLRSGPVALVNGRWLPPAPSAMSRVPDTPCVGLIGDEVAYVVLGPGLLPHASFDSRETSHAPRLAVDGEN